MLLTSKFVSLMIAFGYVVEAISFVGWTPDLWLVSAALTLPLALIWFPDEMGELTGNYRLQIRKWMHGACVTTAGWVFLACMPIIFCLIHQS